jgi:hypothetical protein
MPLLPKQKQPTDRALDRRRIRELTETITACLDDIDMTVEVDGGFDDIIELVETIESTCHTITDITTTYIRGL